MAKVEEDSHYHSAPDASHDLIELPVPNLQASITKTEPGHA